MTECVLSIKCPHKVELQQKSVSRIGVEVSLKQIEETIMTNWLIIPGLQSICCNSNCMNRVLLFIMTGSEDLQTVH